MSTLAGMPISRDPLALANLYNAGLGRNWRNQREAVAAMARFTPKVTREALNRAVSVSKMPEEVISLFNLAGILPVTARHLRQFGSKAWAGSAAGTCDDNKPHREMLEGNSCSSRWAGTGTAKAAYEGPTVGAGG